MTRAKRKTLPEGFTSAPAGAIWVACDACDDEELMFGVDRDEQARLWALEHRSQCPQTGEPS